jgi:hypothetical protein
MVDYPKTHDKSHMPSSSLLCLPFYSTGSLCSRNQHILGTRSEGIPQEALLIMEDREPKVESVKGDSSPKGSISKPGRTCDNCRKRKVGPIPPHPDVAVHSETDVKCRSNASRIRRIRVACLAMGAESFSWIALMTTSRRNLEGRIRMSAQDR